MPWVYSWVQDGPLPNYAGLSELFGGLDVVTLCFVAPSNLGFFVPLGSILQTGNPDLLPVEGGLFYEGPFSLDLPRPCPREVSFFL